MLCPMYATLDCVNLEEVIDHWWYLSIEQFNTELLINRNKTKLISRKPTIVNFSSLKFHSNCCKQFEEGTALFKNLSNPNMPTFAYVSRPRDCTKYDGLFLTFYGRDLEDFRTILVENGFLLPRSPQTDASLIWSNVKSLKWWQKSLQAMPSTRITSSRARHLRFNKQTRVPTNVYRLR